MRASENFVEPVYITLVRWASKLEMLFLTPDIHRK